MTRRIPDHLKKKTRKPRAVTAIPHYSPAYTHDERRRFVEHIAWQADQNRKLQAALDDLNAKYAKMMASCLTHGVCSA